MTIEWSDNHSEVSRFLLWLQFTVHSKKGHWLVQEEAYTGCSRMCWLRCHHFILASQRYPHTALEMAGTPWYMDLGLESSILVGVVRVHELWFSGPFWVSSWIPIFAWGEICSGWWYSMFSSLAHAQNRLTFYFDGMFWDVVAKLCVNVVWVSLCAFAVFLHGLQMGGATNGHHRCNWRHRWTATNAFGGRYSNKHWNNS